jgi:hypothetical protein
MHKNRVECCGLPDVRYAPDSDQIPQRSEMTLCANKRLMRRSNLTVYSITSSARASML